MRSGKDVVHGIITLPEEYLEKILTDPPRRNPNAMLDGLVAAPRIISALVQSIPMPWEEEKILACTYNTDGIVLDCKAAHTEDSVNYICRWLYLIEKSRDKKEQSKREENYTVGEYKTLRRRHPIIEISEKKKKEEIFPLIHQRRKERKDTAESQIEEAVSRHAVIRKIVPREGISIVIKMPLRSTAERKKKKEKEKSVGRKNRKREVKIKIEGYAPPKKEYKSRIGWIKFARMYLEAGRKFLMYVIKERKIGYIEISGKYTVDKRRALKTKEKKKSRLGQTFHVVKELFKLLARVVGIVEKKSRNEISVEDSMEALFREFSRVGINTGIYRYKYSTVRQIAQTARISKILRHCGNKKRRNYSLLWCEPWRVWVLFLQGVSPLLSDRLGNYVVRRRKGRERRQKKETKQREKSNADIQFKKRIFEEIGRILEIGPGQKQVLVNVLKTAWKQWKREEDYKTEIKEKLAGKAFGKVSTGSLEEIERIVLEGINKKGEEWGEETVRMWNRYVSCRIKNKKETKKIRSRITRAFMLVNKKIQKIELERELNREIECGSTALEDIIEGAPENSEKEEYRRVLSLDAYEGSVLQDILRVSIERVESTYRRHLKEEEKKELEYIQACKQSIPHTLAGIIKKIRRKKETLTVRVDYIAQDIAYHYAVEERVIDSFVEYLLAYHIEQNKKSKTLPLDVEPLPCTLIKYGNEIQEILLEKRERTEEYTPTYFTSIDYSALPDEVDREFLSGFLRRRFDPVICRWIENRICLVLEYKDLAAVQRVGICRGLEFYPSITEMLLQEIDKNIQIDGRDRILKYFRCGSTVHILHSGKEQIGNTLKVDKKYLQERSTLCSLKKDPLYRSMCSISSMSKEVATIPVHFLEKLSDSQTDSQKGLSSGVEYSYAYKMSRITPPSVSTVRADIFPAVLRLKDFDMIITEQISYLKTSENSLKRFEISAMKILYDTTGSSFFIIVDRWNRLLLQTVLFFRETLTVSIKRSIAALEERLKRRIMATINTQIKKRFPNLLFYAGKEVGGLGFLSSAILDECTEPWEIEMSRSSHAYDRMVSLFDQVETNNSKSAGRPLQRTVRSLYAEGISINSTGVPRIGTFIHKEKVYQAEVGWRRRNYTISKNRRWTSEVHDGYWMDWKKYASFLSHTSACTLDCSPISGTRKVEQNYAARLKSYISEGTLYRTVRQEWNRFTLPDERNSEDASDTSRLICNTIAHAGRARAQISDAARLPNRMFMLWWSPVVNRLQVNVGHPVEIEGTGILLRGKIPSLRISYMNVFSDGLWMKIQKEVTGLVAGILEEGIITHGIQSVSVQKTNTLRMPSDELSPSVLVDIRPVSLCNVWAAISLRWSDIDSLPVEQESRRYCTDMIETSSPYTHGMHGCAILIDLRKCEYSVTASGEELSGMKEIIENSLENRLKRAVTLGILRKRVMRAVGYSEKDDDRKASDIQEIFAREKTMLIQIGEKKFVGINIETGKIVRFSYSTGTKITKIVRKIDEVLIEEDIQYVCAPEREYSLLCKAQISYGLVKTKIQIDLSAIPESFGNMYAHWPGISPPAALRRLAVLIKHSELYKTEVCPIGEMEIDKEEWNTLEKRLSLEIYHAAAKSAEVFIEATAWDGSIEDSVQSIIFGLDSRSTFIEKTGGTREWSSITNWRDRYMRANSTDINTISEKTERASQSTDKSDIQIIDIEREVIETLFSMSDPLIPVVGFICGKSMEYFITPRQLFSSKNFFITPFDTDKYPVSMVLQTTTAFSQDMLFTYTGIRVPSEICMITLDITTGTRSGFACASEYIGDTLSFSPKGPVSMRHVEKRMNFLTSTGWNRNMCEPADPISILVPEKPLPFYSEEFRISHFLHL